jgi:uncharacterized membrane protein YdbT with pleckstrin-like domain
MKEEFQGKGKPNTLKVLALCISLPSGILFSSIFIYEMAENNIIPLWLAIVLICAIIFNFLMLIVRYASKKTK